VAAIDAAAPVAVVQSAVAAGLTLLMKHIYRLLPILATTRNYCCTHNCSKQRTKFECFVGDLLTTDLGARTALALA